MNNKTPIREREIKIPPRAIEISFLENEDGDGSLVLQLPSAEELAQLDSNSLQHISLRQLIKRDSLLIRERLHLDYRRELSKLDRYSDSSTYFVRLAGYAELINSQSEANNHLKKALALQSDPHFSHLLADGYLKVNELNSAMHLFESCDLTKDVYANLKIAYIYAAQEDIDTAKRYVDLALTIDYSNSASQMFRGAIYIWEKQFERAVRSFRVAAESRPSSSSALHVNLAAAYWGLGSKVKAKEAARIALVINPLNENAAALYSDICFLIGEHKAPIPYLESYVEWEQRSGDMWARLARSYYHIGKKENNRANLQKAFQALNNEKKLNESPTVWNNLALTVWALKDTERAERYFGRAIVLTSEASAANFNIISNLVALLIDARKYAQACKVLNSIIFDNLDPSHESKTIDRLILQKVIVLEALNERGQAISLAREWLETRIVCKEVEIDLLSRLVYHYSTTEHHLDVVDQYGPQIEMLTTDEETLPEGLRVRAINNLAFAYLVFDKTEKAWDLLSQLASEVHKDPYVTATFGLYQLREGNFDKSRRYYLDAVSLLSDRKTKNRFRQRMNLEFGKYFLRQGKYSTARRLLLKSKSEPLGIKYAKEEAEAILHELLSKKQ